MVGDSIGYAIGRRYGLALFTRLGRRFPRHFSRAHLAYAAHVFQRHGATAVFTGRFVALLRILAGPLAGSMHLRYLLANVAGGAAWAGAITVLVAALGTAAHSLVAGAGWGLLILLSVTGLVLSRRIHRRFEDMVEQFAAAARDEAVPAPPLR